MKSFSASLLTAALALGAVSCQPSAPPSKYSQKVVILGFDGMDPELTERWMAGGQLPNFSRLAAQGGYYRLETSHSPESPTSWASFATGSQAGKHNIFDFLVRDPKTYIPDLGIVKKSPPEFLFNYLPIKRPEITSIRDHDFINICPLESIETSGPFITRCCRSERSGLTTRNGHQGIVVHWGDTPWKIAEAIRKLVQAVRG